MKNSLILCCCYLLCCCQIFKKKSEQNLIQDSVRVLESKQQQHMESSMEMHQTTEAQWEGEQFLEIYSAAPYRLHPDSGLLAGAGYLKMRLSGKERIDKWKINSVNSNSSSEGHQRKEEKLKLKQLVKEQQSDKARVPYIWYIVLLAGFALLYFAYKNLSFK